MLKMVCLTLVLVLACFAVQMTSTGLELTEKSNLTVVSPDSTRPSIGVRWSGHNVRNQVVFVPATSFLVVLGLAGAALPVGLAYLSVRKISLA